MASGTMPRLSSDFQSKHRREKARSVPPSEYGPALHKMVGEVTVEFQNANLGNSHRDELQLRTHGCDKGSRKLAL